MHLLKENITHLSSLKGVDQQQFLKNYGVRNLDELTIHQLVAISEEFNISLSNLLLFPLSVNRSKLDKIKLLILDIDGVMTDGGMYFTESGDQFKKYNAKDGMAIMALTKRNFQVGIISSGFKIEMVKARAELLNIQHLYVGRDPKMEVLQNWCNQLEISLEEVAIIGDDINDLAVMEAVGLSVCPSDAVTRIKETADIVLQLSGGKGCVREFIDNYLLTNPI